MFTNILKVLSYIDVSLVQDELKLIRPLLLLTTSMTNVN